MVRWTIHFSGRVQGVGFRYAARSVARGYAVAGYVRNLPDGRVLLVAEGQPDEVADYVAEVREQMAGFIHDQQVDRSPATGEFGAAAPGALRVEH